MECNMTEHFSNVPKIELHPTTPIFSGENVLAAAEKTNSSMEMNKVPPFTFHESIDSAKIGDMAATLEVRYGNHPNFYSNYSFDSTKGTYDRTVNNVKTVDKFNGKEVELSNIVILETAHRTIDNVGRQDRHRIGRQRIAVPSGLRERN